MLRTQLGEFEEVVLLTVAAMEGNAYGVAITHQIIEQTHRNVQLNQVHAALHRLAEKGMVSSRMGAATPERGGRRKRLYSMTASGQQTLLDIQTVRAHLWRLVPQPFKPACSL
jgi:PadR family transcriptional regulator, regulatory protein PadR